MDGLDDAGAVLTGGLVAHAVAGGAGSQHDAHGAGGICANCGAVRTGPYCQTCGQAGHLHRDMTGFAHDVLHGVFHFDGKFWTTLPLLAFRPGELTRRYIDGERAKFVTPMAMFLFSVFLMFAIVSNVGFFSTHGDPGALAESPQQLAAARREVADSAVKTRARIAALDRRRAAVLAAGADVAPIDRQIADLREDLRGLAIAATVMPGADEASPKLAAETVGHTPLPNAVMEQWFQAKLKHFRENPRLTFYKMKTAGYKYSWALIPLSLPFLWLMFAWRRDYGLYDHAVFATYSIAFMSLLVVVLTLVAAWIGGAATGLAQFAMLVVPPAHMYAQLRRGYRLDRVAAAWRTVVLLGVVTLTSTLFFLWLIYLGVAD